MFKKLHLRLTMLFTLFATLILISMSAFYLYINYRGLDENSFESFGTDMSAFITAFDSGENDLLTVKRLQSSYDYLIYIYDNDIPLKITDVTKTPAERELMVRLRDYYRSGNAGETESEKLVFKYGEGEKKYYAGVLVFHGKASDTEVYVLYDTAPIAAQKRALLIRFIIIAAAAAAVFYVFSYFFTKKLLKPIDESQKRQNEFIAAASHEIRNPVNTIMSALSAMEKAEETQQKELVDIARKEGKRLARLTGDLLTLARSDSGTFSAKFGTAELDTIVLDCYEAFSPRAAQKNIRLDIELPEDISQAQHMDGERIKQVVAILLDNALSYTPEGGRIGLMLRQSEKGHIIKVSDSGSGIPDESKEKVFERFYRADDSRSDNSHFGLGLCIAKEIVTMHGGTISVSDTEGGGSTFTVTLPENAQ